MVKRPSAVVIGMWPAGERSSMASRRAPRPTNAPSARRVCHKPASSGPRCACASFISASRAPSPQLIVPTMPHIISSLRRRRLARDDLLIEIFCLLHHAVVFGALGDQSPVVLAGRSPQRFVVERLNHRGG